MNRRAFFGILTAGLTAAADPEKLLWEPGRKLISIPKPTYPGNLLLTPDILAREILETMRRNLLFSKHINSYYDAQFLRCQKEEAMAQAQAVNKRLEAQSVRVRLPYRFAGRSS